MKFIYWLLFALIIFSVYAKAHATDQKDKPSEYSLFLEEASVDYARFKDDSRDPVMYPYTPKERLDTNLNLSLLKYGFINNTIHSETDKDQFRIIGWQYQMGVHIGPWIDLYAEHFSQHLLDTEGTRPYPVTNALGVKIFLYRRGK